MADSSKSTSTNVGSSVPTSPQHPMPSSPQPLPLVLYGSDALQVLISGDKDYPMDVENPPNMEEIKKKYGKLSGHFPRRSKRGLNPQIAGSSAPCTKKPKIVSDIYWSDSDDSDDLDYVVNPSEEDITERGVEDESTTDAAPGSVNLPNSLKVTKNVVKDVPQNVAENVDTIGEFVPEDVPQDIVSNVVEKADENVTEEGVAKNVVEDVIADNTTTEAEKDFTDEVEDPEWEQRLADFVAELEEENVVLDVPTSEPSSSRQADAEAVGDVAANVPTPAPTSPSTVVVEAPIELRGSAYKLSRFFSRIFYLRSDSKRWNQVSRKKLIDE